MKKLFSVILASVLVISMAVTTAAQPASSQSLQMPESFDFSFELNLGLDVQTELFDDPEVEAILAMLRNVEIRADGTLIQDLETFMASHLYMDISVRAGFFYIPFEMWMDVDFTNPEDPVYAVIISLPELLQTMVGLEDPALARQYWVLDYAPLFADEYMAGMLNVMLNSDAVSNFVNVKDMLEMLPELEALGDNNYRLVLTDEIFTSFIIEVVESSMAIFFDEGFMWDIATQFDEDITVEDFELEMAQLYDDLGPILDYIFQVFRNVTFISQDLVTYYVLDENRFPIQENSHGQFIFDLADWANAFATLDPNAVPANNFLPEFVITLDFDYSAVLSNINSATRATLPVLTPENSVDLLSPMFNMNRLF